MEGFTSHLLWQREDGELRAEQVPTSGCLMPLGIVEGEGLLQFHLFTPELKKSTEAHYTFYELI